MSTTSSTPSGSPTSNVARETHIGARQVLVEREVSTLAPTPAAHPTVIAPSGITVLSIRMLSSSTRDVIPATTTRN